MLTDRTSNSWGLLTGLVAALLLAGCLSDEKAQTEASEPLEPLASETANRSPVISGDPPPMVKVGAAYSFRPQASDPDADPLSFAITNKPRWAAFDSSTGELAGMPLPGDVGTYGDIEIAVSDGSQSTSLPHFSITVEPTTAPNMPPEIAGTPPATVGVGEPYTFTPIATDGDGDQLTFSIRNAPSWAAFSSATGQLSGMPQDGDVGTYSGIRIRVSDDTQVSSLPAFSIEVVTDNAPPQISGTPPTAVGAGEPYTFTPTATDADGDPLTFSIRNTPGWAAFDSATGQLSGTPQDGDVGTYSGIRISVSDGMLASSLPDFSIVVDQISLGSTTLSWTAPTENSDGSPLTDLAGFKIYYGTTAGSYPNQVIIDNPGIATYVIDNLTLGTWYFVATSYNSAGVESTYSGVLSKTIN